MTDKERIEIRDKKIYEMIDRFEMEKKCSFSREYLYKKVLRAMVLNNLAFVIADVANTLLLDCEHELEPFGAVFDKTDKYNFKQMLKCVRDARRWAEKSAMPLYEIPDSEDALSDSDWWYNLIKLVDDRLGDNRIKTNMFLEWLLNMPSTVKLFDITYDDFKVFRGGKLE